MLPLRFVPIDRAGLPGGHCPELGQASKESCAATAALYERVGFVPPWLGYLAVSGELNVGICGYTAPPKSGEVEIAYFTFPGFEGRGIATRMAHELLSLARATEPGVVVTAQTRPEQSASTRVLSKLGFRNRGTVVHPEDGEVWEWELAPGSERGPA